MSKYAGSGYSTIKGRGLTREFLKTSFLYPRTRSLLAAVSLAISCMELIVHYSI